MLDLLLSYMLEGVTLCGPIVDTTNSADISRRWDQLKSCLIQLALAFSKDCHFKIINSKVKSLLVHSLNDYIVGPLNYILLTVLEHSSILSKQKSFGVYP